MKRFGLRPRIRKGMSLLELQAAMIVFGIMLSGVAPLTVMQLRQVQRLEKRLNENTTYYVVPSTDRWARKLGAPATITSDAPPPAGPPAEPGLANHVEILSLEKPFVGEELTVRASVTVTP